MGGQEEDGEEEERRYPRKELIFSSLPYAHALTLQARGKVCEGCLSPANPFTECSNCLANHCSTECRSGDLMHTLSCPHPRLSLLPGQSQLVGRLLLRVAKFGLESGGEELPHGAGTRNFKDLMSWSEKVSKEQEAMKVWEEMRAVLPEEVTGDWGHFVEIFGRFMVNGFTINSWEVGSSSAMGSEWAIMGWGLYLGPSILDHSCCPTAKVTFKGLRLEVRSLKPFHDFKKLLVPYLDPKQQREMRRASLRERYFFDCLCPACLGEEVIGPFPRLAEVALQENCLALALEEGLVGEEEREVLTSLLCEECGGMVASKENARCRECGKELGENRFEEFRSAKKAIASLLRSQVKPSGAASQFMDLLEGLFHPHNLTYVRCCQAALCSAIVRDNLGEAVQWGDTLIGAARKVKGSKAHQELALRLARVKEEMGDKEGAEDLREEARES